MGTALAAWGAAGGLGITALIARRRLAVLRLRCADAESENARWRQASGGRPRESEDDRASAPGGWESPPGGVRGDGDDFGAGAGAGAGATVTAQSPDFAERAFVNIGRRVQSIVHRQLGDLIEMEQRHGGDPAVFADLMRLDHGTALIGRLADSLVVLAGERPGRQWTEPVPVFSVLRGAMSRIVDYQRVHLAAAPEAELAGTAVEAVVHALAELLDNATRYSPPDSPVTLTARRVAGGVEIEVEDAGVGMAPQAAEHVARALAGPGSPGLDLADVGGSPRLGLAVIGRLAHTVGFQATVRPSAAGGVKAQLSIPGELVLEPVGASAMADRRGPGAAVRTPPGDPRPPGRTGPAAGNAAAGSRPAGLPQRRRRVPAVEAANGRGVLPGGGSSEGRSAPERTSTSESASAPERTSGPGEWLGAFRGDPPGSPAEKGGPVTW